MTTDKAKLFEKPVVCCAQFFDARITESVDSFAKVAISANVFISRRQVDKLNNRGLREAIEKAVLDNIETLPKASKPEAKPDGGVK